MLVIVLILKRQQWWPYLLRGKNLDNPDKPDTLAGLDVRPQSLPEDVPASARQLWMSGKQREALSLLYRAALSFLLHKRDLGFTESQTEGECQALVQQHCQDSTSRHFTRLSESWILCAYAHRKLPDKQLQLLLHDWHSSFGEHE
ncbi:MAG: hypothetical protein KZQ58_02405 [gamma proteobacterium symbiont of Bathyaustriella thionipta]|nr:hypothetical protein [gamma proteobacterium symbiont of Bathyaustriella thionipta]